MAFGRQIFIAPVLAAAIASSLACALPIGESRCLESLAGQPLPLDQSRPFLLAATGVQMTTDRGFVIGSASLADDVDVIAVHQEFYGLPWREFEQGIEPPAEWQAEMQRLAALAAEQGKPVFLSLGLVGGTGREYLADRTLVRDGKIEAETRWSARCYDFATAADAAAKRDAYLRYVGWMVDLFRPRWLNLAAEVNLFMTCGAPFEALVDVLNAGYDAAKARDPALVAFPSFQVDWLMGRTPEARERICDGANADACFEQQYPRLARIKRDRFAVSSYPYLTDEMEVADQVPDDLLTRAASRGGEQLLIAETGWNSTPIMATLAGLCTQVKDNCPANAARHLRRVAAAAADGNADLVTWWSNRDLLPAWLMTACGCPLDLGWCTVVTVFRFGSGLNPIDQTNGELLLKAFGSMGVRDYDGAPKPEVFDLWQALRALPVAGG